MTCKQETVFIIGNHSTNLDFLVEGLEQTSYKVERMEDDETALEQIRTTKPDIILLLCTKESFEICRRLKADEKNTNIPVIFLIDSSDPAMKVKSFEAGGVDCISKPFEISELLARMKTHLKLYRSQKELLRKNKHLKEENVRRKRVQDALKESRMRYRLLAENSTDMISQQTLQGIYRYVSPACEVLLGYEVEEMIGSEVYEFIHPEDVEQVRKLDNPLQQDSASLTYRARRKDNRYIWMETTRKIVRDPITDIATEIVAISRDVTERKQMAEALWNQNQELDAFARSVAHDLKNPLGTLIGYTDYLHEILPEMDREEMDDVLQRMKRTSEKMVSIIETLMLLSGVRKKKEVPLSPLDMGHIVEQACQRLETIIQARQGEIQTPSKWPLVWGYAPWIEAVWANYISNGLKYGGDPPLLKLGANLQANGMVRFWIRDNGSGLTVAEQENIFTEFTRLNENRSEGHGLGLSIVRRIIERLGGKVGVESEKGHGTIFCFTLPQVD